MPATMWKGAIGFGLVSIPIELQAATGDHDLRLHQVHVKDGGRVRQKRVCEVDGEEVPYSDIAKGYEEAGRQAVLTDDDLADLPLPSTKLIDVLAFVGAADMDAAQYARAYYVVPQTKTADKPYTLLRDTMSEQGQAAVAKVAIGTRESLALLRVKGEVMVLHTMYWPDELRDAPRPAEDVHTRPQEIQMALSLMERMSEGFALAAQADTRQAALGDLVAAKLNGKQPPHSKPEEPVDHGGDDVADLMAALQASMDATDKPAAAKKPAKKTAVKRAGRRKTG